MASGDASLAGAEFTFRYYDGQYATSAEAEASGAPTRTWVFKTNEKGRIRIMDESLKVSGDDLFYNSMGQITLPIGTLLIQETKAPEGYLIDPTVYVRNITPDGTLEAVNSYNAPTVSEQVVTGRIQIVKHTDTGTTKVETPEVGATFNIYLASAGSYDAAPANAKAQLTIDKDGFAVSPDLPYGLYTVEQTSGWEGSRLMEPFTVKIDENGKTYSYIINNERFYSYLKVVKVDAITGEAIPAAGVGFQIIDPKGQKLEWWGADTWYTDGSGVMKLPCELEYGRGYQAVEVVAPSGYVLADKPYDRSRDKRILLALDEFASLRHLEILGPMRKFRKNGANICILTQSLADIDLAYSRDERKVILDNCAYTVVLSGNDPETRTYFSDLVGKEEHRKISTTTGSRTDSTSTSLQEGYAIHPNTWKSLGEQLVVIHRTGYLKLRKNFYFKG